MAFFAISYSTLQEVNRWNQFDLDIILVNRDALHKSLRRQTLLTVEDQPRDFKTGEKTVFAQFEKISMEFSIGVCKKCTLLF